MNLPQSPEEIPTYFASAWNARDAKALAFLFAEDADFVNVVGLWWNNRKDIERAHAYGLSRIFSESTLTAGRIKIRQVGDKAAIVHARWRLTGQTDNTGKQLDERRTVMLFVAHSTADGWQVLAAQNTDIVPGKETFAAKDGKLDPVDYRD